MSESEPISKTRATRAQLAKVIRRRPRVGLGTALLLSVAFATLATPLVALDLILASTGSPAFVAGQPAPVTVRVPHFEGFTDARYALRQGAVVVTRGQILKRADVALVRAVQAKAPPLAPVMAGYFAVLLVMALMYTVRLRRSQRGKLLRTQAVTLLILLGCAVVVKAGLLFTSMSVFVVPLAAIALVATVVVDLTVGLTTSLIASVLTGLLVPFDLGVSAVLLLQTSAACLIAGDHHKIRNARLLGAGLVGGASAAVAYVVLSYLGAGHAPFGELVDPLRSALGAAVLGGVLGGIGAVLLKPLFQYLLGDITKAKLVELEDLSNPLLQQIAKNSPGTWQHSLAMANMAEIAANQIGADGRLVRVGAYYHDLGKSLQPKYFIENLDSGESSPHDRLPPAISCDAIFAHVTEGIRVARKRGLPERIIDFMYMHHGDGLLEYFWAKCRESGNPENLTEDDFRYPGVPPQSRETAILAICDAVEAASRTLKKADERTIGNLVQRIVYGKLHLGQLDQSGLSMEDLRRVSDSLRETIKHAHHGRIEYPWQREQAREEAAAAKSRAGDTGDGEPSAASQPAAARVAAEPVPSATQRIIGEPRLDSLDAPRPYYWQEQDRTAHNQRSALAVAATQEVSAPDSSAETVRLTPEPDITAPASATEARPAEPAPAVAAEPAPAVAAEPAPAVAAEARAAEARAAEAQAAEAQAAAAQPQAAQPEAPPTTPAQPQAAQPEAPPTTPAQPEAAPTAAAQPQAALPITATPEAAPAPTSTLRGSPTGHAAAPTDPASAADSAAERDPDAPSAIPPPPTRTRPDKAKSATMLGFRAAAQASATSADQPPEDAAEPAIEAAGEIQLAPSGHPGDPGQPLSDAATTAAERPAAAGSKSGSS